MSNIELFKGSKPGKLKNIVQKGHDEYENSNGIHDDYQEFYITIEEENKVVGVLSAYIVFAEIYIDDLWVDKNFRSKGYGSKLLNYLESNYENEGFNNINLVTSEFQAPDFYKKNGYELEYIRKNKYNPKLNKYFFVKFFDNSNQHKGIL